MARASIQLADTTLELLILNVNALGFCCCERSVSCSEYELRSNTSGYLLKLPKASLSNTWQNNQKWRYVLEVAPVYKFFVWDSFVRWPTTVTAKAKANQLNAIFLPSGVHQFSLVFVYFYFYF